MKEIFNSFLLIILLLQSSSIAFANSHYPSSEEIQKSSQEYFQKFEDWNKKYSMAQGKISLMLDWNVYFSLNKDAADAWSALNECYGDNETLSAYLEGASACQKAKTLISTLQNNIYNFTLSSHFRWNYLRWQLSRDLILDVRNNFPSHPLFHLTVIALLAKTDSDFWDPKHAELNKMISTDNSNFSTNTSVRAFVNLNILYAMLPSNLNCSNLVKQAMQSIHENSREIQSFQFLYGSSDGFYYGKATKCEENSNFNTRTLLDLEQIYR